MQESLQNAVTDDDDDRRRRRQTPRAISYAAIGPMVHGCKKLSLHGSHLLIHEIFCPLNNNLAESLKDTLHVKKT